MNDELIEYYVNLLILQYRTKEKAREHIKSLCNSSMIYDIIKSVENGYNIENAIGKQLDVIGKYAGVNRKFISADFSGEYFGFSRYGETPPYRWSGYTLYGDPLVPAKYRSYDEYEIMTDDEYRFIIELKIIINNSNASLYELDTIGYIFFDGNFMLFDFSGNIYPESIIEYVFNTNLERQVKAALQSGLLPKPAGVKLRIAYIKEVREIFGYSLYGGEKPDFIVGYSYYGQTNITGGMLVYGKD